jgi:hypothetical protein
MTTKCPEAFERLRKLSAQLHAVAMVSAEEDFALWHPEIRNPYMWLVTDMSREVRDAVQQIVNASSCVPRKQKQQKRRHG